MVVIAIVYLSVLAAAVLAQVTSNPCVTQTGLPTCCVGSYPNLTACTVDNYYISTADPCIPLNYTTGTAVVGQRVYIQDELQNNYYLKGLYPTIVQAEGYVQSYCYGSYLPEGSLALPWGGVRSAQVIKNYTVTGSEYYQIAGSLDCDLLKINCTMSAPNAYDDGGQCKFDDIDRSLGLQTLIFFSDDNVAYSSCGKEPYSGVDPTSKGNGLTNYVEQAGDYEFCMRTCEAGTAGSGGVCDVTQDTAGCYKFMGVNFNLITGFSYIDASNPTVTSTVSVSLPATTKTATGTANAGVTATAGTGTATTAKSSSLTATASVGFVVSLIVFFM
ncbi:hypothetical protein HK100_000861 [Physocladia obscura]|uniref:Uncharacterized protein n=1 Tax=Physocladia obscura TaxID=109957 RepID=A0AAD5XBI2_9FUNG|nr:hypothetical protein HK100_000861 [Physocladia obscura]